MTAGPLVSCIIPVRDGAPYLGAAIESVLDQDHRPLEVIVVDGESTDDSRAVAASYGDRVRVLSNPDRTAPTGRNVGLAAASGALVGFLDADDLYLPGKVTRQVERFAARPELDVSFCFFENFWEEGLGEEEERYRQADRLRASHSLNTILAPPAVYQRVGPMDPTLVPTDQTEWLMRLADCTDLVVEVLPDVLVARRMHPASLSHTQPELGAWVDLVKRRRDARSKLQ